MSLSVPHLGTATVELLPDLGRFNRVLDRGLASAEHRVGRWGKLAIGGVAGLTSVAAGAGAAIFHIGEKFDGAYNKISVGTGRTGRQLGGLEKSFRSVVSNVPTDFDSASSAITELNRRLDLTGRPLVHLSDQILELSRITRTDLNENVIASTHLFNAWGIRTGQQSATLDKLFRLSQRTGIGVGVLAESLARFAAPLQQLHFGFDTSAAMIANFERQGINAQRVMPGLIKALATFARAGRDPVKGLQDTIRQIEKYRGSTKAMEIAVRTFGSRAGPQLATAIEQGRFRLRGLIDVMEHGKGTIISAGRETQHFSEKWDLFRNRVLVLLEPVAIRVFGAVGDAMDRISRINFGSVFAQTASLREAIASVATTVGNLSSHAATMVDHVAGMVISFAQARTGAALLGAVAGGLTGKLIALGTAFAVGKIVSFIGGIRDLISTFGVLRVVYEAQTGITNASTVSVIRFAVAQRIAAGASRGLSAAMASTGFGAFVVLAGTVIGALLGMSHSTERAKVTTQDYTDALRGEADALRALRDHDIDVAQARADLAAANIAVSESELRLNQLRQQGRTHTLDYKAAEVDLEQARVQQERASRGLIDTERAGGKEQQDAKTRTETRITTERGHIRTLRDHVDADRALYAQEMRLAGGVRRVGGDTARSTEYRKRAIVTAARLSREEEQLHRTMGYAGTLRQMQDRVDQLTQKMQGLDHNSRAYRQTARQLTAAEDQLGAAMDGGIPTTAAAGRAFGRLADTAAALGGVLGDVTTYTGQTTTRMLAAFGARPIKIGVKGFKLTPGQKFMQRLGLLQRGGMLQGGEPVGDSIPIMGERGEYMLNRRAVAAIGRDRLDAINFAVAPRHRYQGGGLIGTAISKASEIDSHHYPYKWAGGHDPNFTAPYDCSGAWSAVLHAAGLLGSPLVSGQMMGLGRAGVGAITLLANPGHVYGMLLGRAWGTSASNPGGGAGWIEGGGIRPGFAIRHVGPRDGETTIGRLDITGGTPVMHEIAQGYTDRIVKAANSYLTKTIRFAQPGMGGSGSDAIGGDGEAMMREISKQRGWNFSDWWKVDDRETGHGANIFNAASGAAERGQFLPMNYGKYGPGSDPARKPSVAEQIQSMADYISQRYGNPTRAWAHEQAFNWYRRGGLVGGGPRASTGEQARKRVVARKLMQRIWSAAAHFYPGAGRMPRTVFGMDFPFVGDVTDDNGARAGREILWPDWITNWLVGRNRANRDGAMETLIHEWAHYFQRPSVARGDNVALEGGAQGFARIVAPLVYGTLGMPFELSSKGDDTYYGYVQTLARRHSRNWLLHDQFVGKKLGGPIGAAARRPTGRTLAGSLSTTLRLLGARNVRRRSTSLRGLLRRVAGIGIPKGLVDQLRGFESRATAYGDHADLASQLSDSSTGAQGAFAGRPEQDWVTLQLDALFSWRNAMARARTAVSRQIATVLGFIRRAQRRLADLVEAITRDAHVKADLQRALGNLAHDKGGARHSLEDRIHGLRRSPKRNHALIAALEAQLRGLNEGRAAQTRTLRERIAAIGSQQISLGRERDALRNRILPTATRRRDDMRTDLASYNDNLNTVQGPGQSFDVLGTLPPLGTLGGTIFAAQLRLRDLAAPPPPVTDSSSSGGVGSSDRDQLTQQLIDTANERAYVANRLFDALKVIPFGGVFHEGGVVGGQPGQEVLALLEAGEKVTPAGGGSGTMPMLVMHGDFIPHRPDPFEMVTEDGRFPVAVQRATRQLVRQGPDGRAGRLRRG